jgi:hypothetical protein
MELLIVRPGGRIVCLYTETIELSALGRLDIRRASEVEPDRSGRWFAAIRHGLTLGPFQRRSQALEAERQWLQRRLLHVAQPARS